MGLLRLLRIFPLLTSDLSVRRTSPQIRLSATEVGSWRNLSFSLSFRRGGNVLRRARPAFGSSRPIQVVSRRMIERMPPTKAVDHNYRSVAASPPLGQFL